MKEVKYDPRTKVFLCLMTCAIATQSTSILLLAFYSIFLSLIIWVIDGRTKPLALLVVVGITMLIEPILNKVESNTFVMLTALFVVAIRMYAPIVMAILLVFQTTKISEFMSAFEKVKAPTSVVIPFAVFFRFIPTVGQEWQGIKKAMAFRGIEVSAKNILLKPIQTIEYILVPLLSSSVSILDEMVAASLVRGLDSENERSCYLDIRLKTWDYLIIVITTIFGVCTFIKF